MFSGRQWSLNEPEEYFWLCRAENRHMWLAPQTFSHRSHPIWRRPAAAFDSPPTCGTMPDQRIHSTHSVSQGWPPTLARGLGMLTMPSGPRLSPIVNSVAFLTDG